jgi:hypothetical protein
MVPVACTTTAATTISAITAFRYTTPRTSFAGKPGS